jgi:molybdate transport system substrate-binding protein
MLTSGKLRWSISVLVVLVTGSLITASVTHAVELKVLSPQVMKPVLDDLIQQFERSSGNQVRISYATALVLVREIEAGIVADLAILSPEQIEQLQEEDKIVEDSLTPIAKLEFGVIIRKGATKPDVSTVHSLKQALLSAKSIASGDPETSTSGEFFASLIERLQIDDEIKPKIKTFSSGAAALRAIANGEADIAIGGLAAIEPGTELAGVLPAQAKKFNSYAVGILASSSQLEAAKALASFITSRTSLAVMKSKGFEAP